MAGEILDPDLTAAAPSSNSTMVCVKPRPAEAAAIADPDGDPAESLHVTLCFLGDVEGDLDAVAAALRPVAASHAPLEGTVAGYGTFAAPDGAPWPAILLPDVPGLVELRVAVTEALLAAGVDYSRLHGFAAHVTLEYVDGAPPVGEQPFRPDQAGAPLHFDDLLIVRGDVEIVPLPLTGATPLTAAAEDSLVGELRAAFAEPVEIPGAPGWSVPKDALDRAVEMVKSAKAADLVEAIAAVAEAHQAEAEGYGQTAWNADTRTVLYVAGDWTDTEPIEADFLELDGVDAFEPEYEAMPTGWCDAEIVYGGDPFAGRCDEEAAAVGDRCRVCSFWLWPVDWMPRWKSHPPPGVDPSTEPNAVCDYCERDSLVAAARRPFCLPAELRTKTDPVREAFLRTVMTPPLQEAGVAFDVTNPLAADVLSKSGAHVKGIAQTTQLDVMKVINASYEQGLSIPDTAKAIRAYMTEASATRATMIARTELAAAANGGSLAATQIVAEATDEAYFKQWMTAPGALNPRHEDYDGLDGQTVQLEDYFDVGGNSFQYPGDPDGDPGDSINCRCTLVYTDKSGDLTDAAESIDSMMAAGRRRAVDRHNAILEAAYRRVDELEPHLAAVLEPILLRAGELAAARFEELATEHLTAAPLVPIDPSTPAPIVAGWTAPAAEEILPIDCEGHGLGARDLRGPLDTVSVDAGAPITTAALSKIDDLGLDRPLADLTPTTAVGRDVYASSRSTEELYASTGDWTADRAALHDQIVAAHFEGKAAAAEGKPTSYFTAGGGASGKSAAVFEVGGKEVGLDALGAREDVVWIDPDRIKEMLPEYAKLRDAGDFYAASGVHEESSIIAARVTAEAQKRGLSVIVDTTGSSSKFVSKMEAASAAGYDVQVTMFSIPTNEAIMRSIIRGEKRGRYVALEALKSAHSGASAQLAAWKDSSIVKSWRVYDNSGTSPELVAEGFGGTSTIYDQAKFDEILAKADEKSAGLEITTPPPLPATPPEPVASVRAEPTPHGAVLDALGAPRYGGAQGPEEIAAGLDPAVARSLWYLPDVGPAANELVRRGVNPATIAVDPRKASTLSQTFRDAIAAGRSQIKTWADVIAIAERDALPLNRDVVLARGMTLAEIPKVGDVISDARGMASLTSDPETADAFALHQPPPAARGRMGANPADEEAIAAMLEHGGPRQFLAPGEKAVRVVVDTPSGTFLWNPGGDLDEFVLPKGSQLRITEVREPTVRDNFEPYADTPPPVDYIVRAQLLPPAETPSVATIVPGPSADTAEAVQAFQQPTIDRIASSYPVPEWATVKMIRDDFRAKLDGMVAEAVAGAEVRTRVSAEILDRIVADGRFKSQFETNRSGGALAPEVRADAEHVMFGYEKDLDPSRRPIYGYLSGSVDEASSGVDQYGPVVVRLNESVRARATFTLTDSLGAGGRGEMLPVPLEEPSSLALYVDRNTGNPLRIDATLEKISTAYAEAQIHGGLAVSDIEEVVFSAGNLAAMERVSEAELVRLENTIVTLQMKMAEGRGSLADATILQNAESRIDDVKAQVDLYRDHAAGLRQRLAAAGVKSRVVDDLRAIE